MSKKKTGSDVFEIVITTAKEREQTWKQDDQQSTEHTPCVDEEKEAEDKFLAKQAGYHKMYAKAVVELWAYLPKAYSPLGGSKKLL